ncbi:MAG TPA: hypothetical protein VFG87_11770 [Amycolatopsis sp.]|nr:hypothetical protein [Amycolatopsis sp.]
MSAPEENGALGDLQIIGAAYGRTTVTSKIIGLVNRASAPQSLSIVVSNRLFGDTWPGVDKSLTVVYRYGETGASHVASAKEGNRLTITGVPGEAANPISEPAPSADAVPPRLTILGATYGPVDKTAVVRGLVSRTTESLAIKVDNQTFGDTWKGVDKTLVVVAAYPGEIPFVDIVTEGKSYLLKYRPQLRILSATWGLADVTGIAQRALRGRSLSLKASNEVLGEGWPGADKTLAVVYRYGSEQPQIAIATEGKTLSIGYSPRPHYEPNPDPRTLNVIKACYGRSDVTELVAAQARNNRLRFRVGNALFGDTWPGVKKSFDLTYSWGPMDPLSLSVPEGSTLDVQLPTPSVSTGLVSLAGLFADGDIAAIQAGNGRFWTVDPTRKIAATAESRQAATDFTLHVAGDTGQVWLTGPDGAAVCVGADGYLAVGPGRPAAAVVPSLTTTGSIAISVLGQAKPYAALGENEGILASGSYLPTFDACFSLRLMATDTGTESHLRACGVNPEPELAVDWKLAKLIWDLTGGFFLAIGLGPLIRGKDPAPGFYALITQNPRVNRALQEIIDKVYANPGSMLPVVNLFAFIGVLWDAGLMWKIFRFLLVQGSWYAGAWAAAELLKWTVLPEAAAAELLVSFAIWAYTTTTDALAYVNSIGRRPALTEQPVTV